ncbi:MAG: cyclase [Planctomycetota bacterium]|jgi:cyclase
MLKRRIVPCLDVRDGRVVKGIRFAGLRDAGDPAELAAAYAQQGADEIVLLDVAATPEGRQTAHETVRAVRERIDVPLTVGGGVRSVSDAEALLEAGADKVAINTAAVVRPELLTEIARQFGTQCTVIAIDARRNGGDWYVTVESGQKERSFSAVEWAKLAVSKGAGEILLTSWDRDGTGAGYDLELLAAVRQIASVPLIASGGAENPQHLMQALDVGVDAVLVASMLHSGAYVVSDLKRKLKEQGVEVRVC